MAEIALKTFLHELDALLENEAHEEVIGRCKHVLKTFPKHLDTYRILGKALLEKNRHQDAADVFQRVLSAEPRDFISHAGMSIVYEEQNQLNEAIWHMERAFEQEPNNQALQEELRRLYRQRDGFEPPAIQLTAGALASQYMRGGMYAQAIAELRRTLADHPDRMDLQVMLVESLWQAGKRKEAGELAVKVLEKLPNCLVAHRVLGELWLSYGRGQEAVFFLTRVETLDPYLVREIVKPGIPVTDAAVTVPELEWSGAAASLAAGAPDWVAAVGEAFADVQEDVPDWAHDLGTSAGSTMSVAEALDF
ncbi:MAG: tetratricopeptide repeat protein [Anaerolineae bacterium]|nr:tetratricopeptide repeat protein [Anaerolineae bacterium]